MVFTCGIIEDEPLGGALLKKYVSRMDILELRWMKASVEDLLAGGIDTGDFVDLVFMDLLDTPSDSGFKVNRSVEQYGRIVITTACPERFVKTLGIRYAALLNKPISFDAFQDTVTTVMQNARSSNQ